MLTKICRRAKTGIVCFVMAVLCFHHSILSAAMSKKDMEDLFNESMNVPITMDLEGASLRDVLKMLSVQSGLNFISSEAVADRKITLYLDEVMLKDALDKIFTVNNLSYELDPQSNIFTVKDWGKPSIELATRIYFLKYASATNSKSAVGIGGMKDALGNVMSEYGKIKEDPATNSMVITDMPSKFSAIEEIITKLDIPIPQLMIEVEVLDVSKADVDKLGFKYGSGNVLSYTGPNFGSTYPFTGATLIKGLAGRNATTQAKWNMTGLAFVFDFLATRESTKFLARPKIFVLNNETGEIKLSADEAIGSITTTQGQGTASTTTSSVERAETGVTLKVTPQISMATGEITMTLEPIVKETVKSVITVSGQSDVNDVEERSIKSTVRVKDGETIILGGLIRQRSNIVITKFGFLGDIPILGMLFRHKNSTPRKDREILVFVTPKIIKSPVDLAKNKPVSSKMLGDREQESFINPKRNDIVSRALGVYETR